MRVITMAVMLAGLMAAVSLNAFAEGSGTGTSGCKKGYTLDADSGKCIKEAKGSH